MAHRLIGMEITPGEVRLAVLGEHRGTVAVIALEQRAYADASELSGLLENMIPDGFQLSDRVITALPAGQAYTRTLLFPFRDRRKVLAAAPFELAGQLPVTLEDCQVAMLTPRTVDDGARTTAAAVAKADIEALLAPFDRSRTPLRILDLMPYALAGGLGDTVGSGLLACVTEREAILACLQDGQLIDYRQVPLTGQDLDQEIVGQFLRESLLFRNRTGQGPGPLLLTGALATAELVDQAREYGLAAEILTLAIGHQSIPPAFVPAVALALRAGKKVEDRCFNLRQGPYAYHGEATALKRTLYGLGGLLGMSLLLLVLATALDYREKDRQAAALLQQMTRQYNEAFPGSTITVDIPLQMQSKLQELRNRAAALGIDSQPRMLPILKELSAVTARTPYEVEELSCDRSACSLSGSTDSFDAVNRIKEQLGTSALFGKIEVAETHKGIDGSRIDFRLRLPLTARGGRQ